MSGNAVTFANPQVTQTFYPNTLAKLGTVNNGCLANDSSGCCTSAQITDGNCPCAVKPTTTKIPSRVAYGPGTGSQVDGNDFNLDFILASTYQDSFSGTGTRATAPNNYCDVQVKTATDSTKQTFLTTQGFTGKTKCTYIFIVAATKGAPAFKLTQADFTMFQLHYVEWVQSEITFLPETFTTPSFLGSYTPNTFPMPLKGTYPPGTSGAQLLSWTYPVTG